MGFIKKIINKKNKLNKILNCIENIEIKDDSVLLEFKKDLILFPHGYAIIYSDKEIAIKGKFCHIQPETNIRKDVKELESNKLTTNIKEDNEKKLQELQKKKLQESSSCSCNSN